MVINIRSVCLLMLKNNLFFVDAYTIKHLYQAHCTGTLLTTWYRGYRHRNEKTIKISTLVFVFVISALTSSFWRVLLKNLLLWGLERPPFLSTSFRKWLVEGKLWLVCSQVLCRQHILFYTRKQITLCVVVSKYHTNNLQAYWLLVQM